MSEQIEIIIPATAKDPLTTGLRSLTAALAKVLPDADTFYGLGGENGYGIDFENDTFAMRRFYWGDCDCGYEEREAAFSAADPGHSPDCYQTELHARMEAYDAAHPEPEVRSKTEVVKTDFGTMTVSGPVDQSEVAASRDAYAQRREYEESVFRELAAKHDVDPHYGAAIHCTCGKDKRWQAWAKENGHTAACALVLPNFHYKATGFKVRWYKWIGRDNETEGDQGDLNVMFADCLRSVTPSQHRP